MKRGSRAQESGMNEKETKRKKMATLAALLMGATVLSRMFGLTDRSDGEEELAIVRRRFRSLARARPLGAMYDPYAARQRRRARARRANLRTWGRYRRGFEYVTEGHGARRRRWLYGLLFGAVAAVPVAVVSKLAARWANPPAPAPNPRVLPGEPTMTLSERRGAIAYALACFAEMCRRHAR